MDGADTWRYGKLTDIQRQVVMEQRDRVLRTDAALRELARRCPNRFAELSAIVSEDVPEDAARQITLWHLDAGWADHLSYLADLREGIHLRGLGRGISPLDEFHAEAVRAFSGLLKAVWDRSAESLETVPVTANGADLGAAGLKRPAATWTYLVRDNPFGTDIDRALASVARGIRKLLHD